MAYAGWLCAWQPGIGDPTFRGWLTVAAYLASAYLCWRARWVALEGSRAGPRQGSKLLWGVFAAGLAALGVNKQLDLQSALAEMSRAIVQAMDWHESRRALQLGFIGVVVVLAVGLCLWLTQLAREEIPRTILALIGWVALSTFVAIRAASFHHIDRLLGTRMAGARVSEILELGGITLIAIGALYYCRIPK